MSTEQDFVVWNAALEEWGDGPRTMKATADWANRWIHRLRTEDERKCIALSRARAEGYSAGIEDAAKECDERARVWAPLGRDAEVATELGRAIRALAPNGGKP